MPALQLYLTEFYVKLIAHILNISIWVPQRYEKWRGCYTSIRCAGHNILFVGGRITDMPHVDGIDDGAGCGVMY